MFILRDLRLRFGNEKPPPSNDSFSFDPVFSGVTLDSIIENFELYTSNETNRLVLENALTQHYLQHIKPFFKTGASFAKINTTHFLRFITVLNMLPRELTIKQPDSQFFSLKGVKLEPYHMEDVKRIIADYARVTFLIEYDAWYSSSDESWSGSHIMPNELALWRNSSRRLRKNDDVVQAMNKIIQIFGDYSDNDFVDTSESVIVYFNEGETFVCTDCDLKDYVGFLMHKNCENKLCRECIAKRFQKRYSSGEPLFACPSCNHDDQMDFKLHQHQAAFFAEKYDFDPFEIYSTTHLDQLEAKLDAIVVMMEKNKKDWEPIQQIFRKWEELSNNAICDKMQDRREKLNERKTKLETDWREMKVQGLIESLESQLDKIVEARQKKEWETMYAKLDEIQTHFDVLRNILHKPWKNKEHKLLGKTGEQWAFLMVKQVFTETRRCINLVGRCGICCSYVEASEEKMLQTHKSVDFIQNDRRAVNLTPCQTCADCFDNYMAHATSLGKPQLKCPAMSCVHHMEKDHVKVIAPLAYESHVASLMKFELKKCGEFKFCPNAECGAGFLVPKECCPCTENPNPEVACLSCDTSFCGGCHGSPHEGKTCLKVFREQHAERWGEEKIFVDEAKQCPFCLVWIEKNGGCDHMTCHHCRGEFCWLCSGNWRTHGACENSEAVERKTFVQLFPVSVPRPPRPIPSKKRVYEKPALPEVDSSDSEYSDEDIYEAAHLRAFLDNFDMFDSDSSEEPLVDNYRSFAAGFGFVGLETDDEDDSGGDWDSESSEFVGFAAYWSDSDENSSTDYDDSSVDLDYLHFLSGWQTKVDSEGESEISVYTVYSGHFFCGDSSSDDFSSDDSSSALRDFWARPVDSSSDDSSSDYGCPEELVDQDGQGYLHFLAGWQSDTEVESESESAVCRLFSFDSDDDSSTDDSTDGTTETSEREQPEEFPEQIDFEDQLTQAAAAGFMDSFLNLVGLGAVFASEELSSLKAPSLVAERTDDSMNSLIF